MPTNLGGANEVTRAPDLPPPKEVYFSTLNSVMEVPEGRSVLKGEVCLRKKSCNRSADSILRFLIFLLSRSRSGPDVRDMSGIS